MTVVSSKSAVDRAREDLRQRCGEPGIGEPAKSIAKELGRWVAQLDDSGVSALLDQSGTSDADAARVLWRLAETMASTSVASSDGVSTLVNLLQATAELSAERVCVLQGMYVCATASLGGGMGLTRHQRHTLVSPLQAALLNLELTALEREDDADLVEALGTIKASLDQAVALLTQQTAPDTGIL